MDRSSSCRAARAPDPWPPMPRCCHRAEREPSLAVQYRTELLDLDPFRETAYRQLMQLHAAMGNRAEALRVFERCRTLLRDELGASPSQQTEALFLEILRAGE